MCLSAPGRGDWLTTRPRSERLERTRWTLPTCNAPAGSSSSRLRGAARGLSGHDTGRQAEVAVEAVEAAAAAEEASAAGEAVVEAAVEVVVVVVVVVAVAAARTRRRCRCSSLLEPFGPASSTKYRKAKRPVIAVGTSVTVAVNEVQSSGYPPCT